MPKNPSAHDSVAEAGGRWVNLDAVAPRASCEPSWTSVGIAQQVPNRGFAPVQLTRSSSPLSADGSVGKSSSPPSRTISRTNSHSSLTSYNCSLGLPEDHLSRDLSACELGLQFSDSLDQMPALENPSEHTVTMAEGDIRRWGSLFGQPPPATPGHTGLPSRTEKPAEMPALQKAKESESEWDVWGRLFGPPTITPLQKHRQGDSALGETGPSKRCRSSAFTSSSTGANDFNRFQ